MVKPKTIDNLLKKVLDQRRLLGRRGGRVRRAETIGAKIVELYQMEAGSNVYSKEHLNRVLERLRSAEEGGWRSRDYVQMARRLAADIDDMAEYGAIADSVHSKNSPWGKRRNPLTRPVPDSVKADPDDVIGLSFAALEEMERLEYSSKVIGRYRSSHFPRLIWFFVDHGTTRYSDELIDSYIANVEQRRETFERSAFTMERAAALHVRCMHRGEGLYERTLAKKEKPYLTGRFAQVVAEYAEWRRLSGKKESTIEQECINVSKFLECLAEAGCDDLGLLTREHVRAARKAMSQECPADRVRRMLPSVRAFSDFCEEEHPEWPAFRQWIGRAPRVRKKAPIPGYTEEQARAIVDSVDLGSKAGKRDRAILLLAKSTGLRAIDIANLRFCDIDWRAKTIRTVQEKTGEPVFLPLSTEAGEAIAAYILESRRGCDLEVVFITAQGPMAPLNTKALYRIVKKYAGPICGPGFKGKHGIHAFRRGLGASLVEAETPVEDVSLILGQKSAKSASPYVGVAVEKMRAVCAAGLDDTLSKGGCDASS